MVTQPSENKKNNLTGDAIIEIVEMHKWYDDFHVLKDINLTVKKQERIVICGPSGSGKSTLLYVLSTMDTDYEGTLLINGDVLTGKTQNQLAAFRNEHIGFVFQFHHLLPEFTALENTFMPGMIGGHSKEKLMETGLELLAKVGLENRFDHKVGELSGGEQQRVAIARAMAAEPHVILADEPTANLDSHTAEELLQLMRRLNREQGTTFIFSSHDDRVIAQARRVIHLQDGCLASDDTIRT